MLGKASEIKISDPQRSCQSVRGWFIEHPECIVLDIKATAEGETDWFHIIYKEV